MRHEQFEHLYQTHSEPLYAFLVYRTGDRALAEDLLADTFERVLRARKPYDPRQASEKTWVYTIALNLLRDHGRREATASRAIAKVAITPGRTADRPEDVVASREFLSEALALLSDDEREAVALRFGADLSLPEMAKLLGEKLTTVEGRVYRALRKLRGQLQPTAERVSPATSQEPRS